jgi:hypothetical protein
MRFLMVLFLIGLCQANAQSTADDETNARCIERLRMPAYPKLADSARLSGTVTATITLTASGSIEKSVLEMTAASAGVKQFFLPSVEEALRASTFRNFCGGKSVKLVFSFVLNEEREPSVSFGYPNRFWITVPPGIVHRSPPAVLR